MSTQQRANHSANQGAPPPGAAIKPHLPPHWLALRLASPPLAHAPNTSTATVTDPLAALAWRALQLTPWVAQLDGALVLETSASERLFGGRSALLHKLLVPVLAPLLCAQGPSALVALGRLYVVAQGVADGAALALVEAGAGKATRQATREATGKGTRAGESGGGPSDTPGAERAGQPRSADLDSLGLRMQGDALFADALPLAALAAARAHVPTLERLGCRSWGQLRALPRAGVARRFGSALLAALDQAYGVCPEVYPWLHLPEVFDAPLELAAQVDSAPALQFGARRLLAQLLEWLRARQRGVLVLELRWELDARRSNALHLDAHHDASGYGRLELRTAHATQNLRHLERLLAEQLACVVLPAPVLYLRLRTLATQPLSGESHSLLVDEVRSGDSLHHMLERVAARLGPEQVLSASIQADHRPERMQHWQPYAAPGAEDAASQRAGKKRVRGVAPVASPSADVHLSPASGALYPSWLLATPQSLLVQHAQPQFHGPLALLVGPQRLEAGWLEGEAPALRDYYIARSQRHGLLWIYCERLGGKQGSRGKGELKVAQDPAQEAKGQWYLHGFFA
jgi:protein ImuB